MLFRQFVDDDLGCASYLIGEEDSNEAVVVDPAYWIEPYLAEAARRGVRIARVLETHTHADHISGHGRLALEHGVPVAVHPAAEPEFDFEPLEDGAELELGRVCVRVLHTPGHRPEHCCFAVSDRSRGDEPWLALTGDSLLVGDAARPDLAVEAREGARGMYRSLHRLLELPDGVEVYPGHVAGSLCGSDMNAKGSSTIGFERRFNAVSALLSRGEEAFVDESAPGGLRPPNMDRIVALNRGPFLGRPPELEPAESPGRATVLDIRSAEDFAAGHVRGALNVSVDGSAFPTKAAFVLSPDEQVVLHAASPEQAQRAARGLRSVGLFELAGYLLDPEAPERLETLHLDELERLLEAGEIDVLDVREPHERDRAYIPGSRNVPYRLVRDCADDLRNERPVATICESGSRAAVAASILAAAGIDARPVLGTGVRDWQQSGRDTVTFRRCAG